jgi:BASS family bile acid:Na+ symporter
MTLAELLPIAVKASIVVFVFGLALNASPKDVTYLLQRPALLVRSLVSMNIIMPMFAAALAALFGFHRALEIALIALAVSPVPPILPKKQAKAGGTTSYAIGLLAVAALFAIVFVPLAVELLGWAFARPAHISAGQVASVVLLVLAPLAAGFLVRQAVPDLAQRIANPISLFATLLLFGAAVAIVVSAWPLIASLVGNGTVVAIVMFILVGLAAGHLLGGPEPDDRTVLALATANRHPGVALAIATANFPEERAVLAAVLLYVLVGVVVSIPYVAGRKRSHASLQRPTPNRPDIRAAR